MNTLTYTLASIALLVIHWGYAFYLIRSQKDPLHEGRVTDPRMILSLLVLINSACFWAPFTQGIVPMGAHLAFRGLLLIDELRRLPRARHRSLFAFDHLAWLFCLLLLENPRTH